MDTLPIQWAGEPLAGLGMGVAGAWYAMLVDVLIRSIVLLARFSTRRWRNAEGVSKPLLSRLSFFRQFHTDSLIVQTCPD